MTFFMVKEYFKGDLGKKVSDDRAMRLHVHFALLLLLLVQQVPVNIARGQRTRRTNQA